MVRRPIHQKGTNAMLYSDRLAIIAAAATRRRNRDAARRAKYAAAITALDFAESIERWEDTSDAAEFTRDHGPDSDE
jgi:hypothetical protein